MEQEHKLSTNCKYAPIDSQEWLRKDYPGFQFLNLKGNIISAAGGNVCAFSNFILLNRFLITIKLTHIYQMFSFGVCDVENSRKGYLDQNYISFWNDGKITINGRIHKYWKGFSTGATLSISGDLSLGKIEFKINDEISLTDEWDKLNSENIQWIPFIFLWDRTSVEIFPVLNNLKLLPCFFTFDWFDWDDDLISEVYCLTDVENKNKMIHSIN